METYAESHRLEDTPADCHVESLGEILPRLLERYGIDVPLASIAVEVSSQSDAELELVA
ncbi:MAG: hypothetical protein WD648_03600 [Planctomycetaceae bacterium]